MRVTVDIDEETLGEVTKLTGIEQNSPAIAFVVRDFVLRHRAEAFTRLLKETKFDYLDKKEPAERQDA